ncbi:unnamed protein product [Bursaphelenchus xylophilus]|uniref:(pine wood nematode) hypothetical protein n=1 Tax=Bursaphelenchus xylophilus TaxID=6326 RepID=A0A1I7RZQ4_BURXY|nr:unnamed protein product [Bursaphelenchus xylophilus]CAG9111550.1 unnamed protein product [Bursaphelenchus xylophilus]
MSMWLVIACFVLPAAVFSLCGFIAWLRMWQLGRRREKKVFQQLEEHVRQRYEACRHGRLSAHGTLRTGSTQVDLPLKSEKQVLFV